MKIYDISLPIFNELVVWPGDPSVSLTLTKSIIDGNQCNLTRIQMGAHTGTHIDAPFHFLADGSTTDAIDMETFIGPCVVVEVDSKELIAKEDLLNANINGFSRVLIKTRNSELWANNINSFNENYAALGIDAAQYLIEMNFLLVGIDYLSIESFRSNSGSVHKLLLEKKITILEGLNLSGVIPGDYELICLPLRLQACEGAPARVILREL